MPTLADIISDINLRLPHSTNSFTDAIKAGWMNQLQYEVWRWLATTNTTSFEATTTSTTYTLSTNIIPDQIKRVRVYDSTGTTGGYQDYTFADWDSMEGSNWYIKNTGFGLYPAVTTTVNVEITHVPKPADLSATGASTTIPVLDSEFHELYKYRVMKIIAQAGNSPDIELANNYQALEDEMMGKIKMQYYRKKQAMPAGKPWSYKRGWYNG